MSYPRYQKQRVAVTSSEWTPISPTYPMDYFAMRCDSSALTVRTDKDDAATEDTLVQSAQESVMAPGSAVWEGAYGSAKAFRFQPGVPACWVKSVQTSAVAVVTWVA